jgi:fatty acid desaturase
MSTAMWLTLAGGVIGAAVAIYGLVTLLSSTHTASDPDPPRRRRSALYSLFFGASLMLIGLASLLNALGWTVPAMLALVASMSLLGVAVVRYRPGSKASVKAR